MSSTTAPSTPAATGVPEAPPSQPEMVIQQRLAQARRHVRGVDLAAGLLRLVLGVLLYLLAFAVFDHWLVSGGLGVLGRALAFLVLLAGSGAYVARAVVPALLFRIHPLFAAQALERGRPGVKNSLINFLLLRQHRQELQPAVYDTVQRQAAADVAGVEIEAVIDRSHVFRLGYLLAGVLAVCCLYLVLSPKSPITSAARVLWPFGRIAAPTRVTIREIEPGNAVAYLGDNLTVTAVVRGIRDDEPVTLYFSTTDGQLAHQAVPMTLPDRDYRHRVQLPPGGRGFQQDATYLLAAGDFRSEPFRIDVHTAPAIVVERVVLDYPGYAGLKPRTLRRQGDLSALEGTRATIYAEANQPIRRAEIDLGSEGKHGIPMRADGRQAVGTFTLRLDPNDPARPQHDSYQLQFADATGRLNPRPIRHRIDVIRDLPPEVVLVEPKASESRVAADGRITMQVRAEDPDFALRRVGLQAVSGGRDLVVPPLLAEPATESGFRGVFTAEFEFVPSEFALKPGDRVLYWAEAEDIRQPTAGRAETDRRWLEITEPTGRAEAERREPTSDIPPNDPEQPSQPEQQNSNDPSRQPGQATESPEQDAPDEPSAPDAAQAEQGQPDDEQQPEAGNGELGESSGHEEGTSGNKPEAGQGAAGPNQPPEATTPVDPETNPGDAIERILEHRQRQQAEQPEQPQPEQPSDSPKEQSAEAQPGSPSDDPAGQQPDPNPKPQDQPGTEPSEGQADGPKPEQPGGEKPGEGGQPGSQAQPGEQPGSKQQPGGGDPPAGQPEPAPDQPGGDQETTPGQKPPGAQPSGTDEPQGGPAEGSGEQPPGQMRPSPESGDSGSQRQPGASETPEKLGRETPAGGAPEPGNAEQTGADSEPSPQRVDPDPGRKPQDGGTQGDEQMQEQSPGAGTPSEQPGGSPSPQEDNMDRTKNPGQVEAEPAQRDQQSPSISPKQSDTEGDTAGDRSGGGEEGGGQRANQPGVGSPGTQTDAESGSGISQQQGDGEPGSRPGEQIEAEEPTGSSAQRPGSSRGERGQSGGQQPAGGSPKPSEGPAPPGQAMQKPPDGGQPGEQVSEGPGAHGSGTPTQGGNPDRRAAGERKPPAGEPGAEAANLEFARKQTQLALEHLKDQANKPDSDLLEQLGWSEAEARRFIDQWEQLRRRAGRDGEEGRQARQSLDQALQSLGLRPRGTELRRGATPTERLENIREAGRFQPPSEWVEQFEAYTRSIAEGER